jgi:hypothetical protein
VKDENGDLLADSQNILNKGQNYFSQLLNLYNVSDVRQIEVHTENCVCRSCGQRKTLHHRIVDACQLIRNIVERMRSSMTRRVEAIIKSHGGYFEHLPRGALSAVI